MTWTEYNSEVGQKIQRAMHDFLKREGVLDTYTLEDLCRAELYALKEVSK